MNDDKNIALAKRDAQLVIRLPKAMKLRLARDAKRLGISVADLIILRLNFPSTT